MKFDQEELDLIVQMSIDKERKTGEYTNITCEGDVEELKQQLYDYNDMHDRCFYGYLNYIPYSEVDNYEEIWIVEHK